MAKRSKLSSEAAGIDRNMDEVVRELDSVKRLLILMLAKLGSDSNEIAMALDVAPTTIRSWLPMRRVVRLPFTDTGNQE